MLAPFDSLCFIWSESLKVQHPTLENVHRSVDATTLTLSNLDRGDTQNSTRYYPQRLTTEN